MNKNCYRIVFNAKRGLRMAVAETATAQGKDGGGETRGGLMGGLMGSLIATLRPTSFAISAALGMVLWAQAPARAQIVADPSAPANQRPTVLQTANGLPQVNIQTPSAAGVSRNTYSQFDVQPNGAVLNNSRTNVQTQTGGWVQGNPWLATGSARVILNEVNASNPSQLKGYVEVAGQRAEVVIANPAGIAVNGGGFLNASSVTLTTGAPVMNTGSLESYRVQRGSVSIDGAGLDTRTADYTRILARAVQVNAGIWAKDLHVVTGANQIEAPSLSAATPPNTTPIAGTGAAPAFALDTAQLGGMYAGKIILIGTEAGVGVRHNGVIGATAGDVVLQTSGWLSNSGSIRASGNAQITAQGDISNSGQINSDGTIALNGAGLDNQGGQVQAVGDVTINAGSGAVNNSASLLRAGQTLAIFAGNVANSNTLGADQGLEGQSVAITATRIANDSGAIRADQNLTLASSGSVDNSAGLISAVQNLQILDPDAAAPATKTLAIANTNGTLIAGQNLMVDSSSLSGDGRVLSQGDLHIKLNTGFSNAGEVIANHNASISTTGDLGNSALLQAGNHLNITAANIDNAVHGEISAISTHLVASDTLVNRGLIDGSQTLVQGDTVNNLGTGRIYGDHVAIAATTLTNEAENGVAPIIAARHRLDIGAQTIDNREHALIFSAGDLSIGGALDANRQATGQADILNNASATIESLGNLSIAAARLNNTNAYFSTAIVALGSPESRFLIQPSGSPTRYGASNFAWVNWSRAGLYRYVGVPAGSTGILGQTEIARVGEQNCTGDEANEVCSLVGGAEYPRTDPAWSWFNLTPPDVEPSAPALATPAAPNPAGASACEAGAGYNASACTAYNTAFAQYNADQATFDAAWSNYHTGYAAWQTETEARRDALDTQIEAYNAGFANPGDVKNWTQYATTVSQSQSVVTQSDPGQILSGGAMRLTGGELVNDKSRIIAGGALSGDLHKLRNIEAEGVRITQEAGTSQYTWSRWRGGFKRYHERNWDAAVAYTPADIVDTITLAVTEQRQNTAPAGVGAGSGLQLANAGIGQTVGAASPAALPDNALFRRNPDPAGQVLIETDPRFAGYRNWLSSDYLLQALASDPAATQKRLGDGFYEQRLIREQVAQLTGRRFLDGYADDEAQYRALLDAGITYAQAHQLRPGIALSAAQMARLTSDIVWLVEREVVLADGTKQQVLVPQVYVRVRDGDLKPDGALIAGDSVNLNLSGDLTNAGTIAGRTVVSLSAENIRNLGGRIDGDSVNIQARQDLNNLGGRISAADTLIAGAGRDLNLISTTQTDSKTAGLSSFSRTNLDRVAGLYVTGDNAILVASAGRDAKLIAAQIVNSGRDGQTLIAAGRDLKLGTLATAEQNNSVRNAANFLKQGGTQDIGSSIQTQGDLRLQAGNDLNAQAATVASAQGALIVQAGNSVTLGAGQSATNFEEARQHTSKGFLSSKTTTTRASQSQTQAIASTFSGDTVIVQAGRDIAVTGSNVVSDAGTTLIAGRDINLTAQETSSANSNFQETSKSGLFSSGGLSITLGKQQQSTDQQNTATGAAAATVGAVAGDVNIVAGQRYTQVGSNVVAPGGDINVLAQDIAILDARTSQASQTEQKFKQSGLTLALTSPVISAVQTMQGMAQAAGQTSDGRMKALAAGSAALAAKSGYDAIKAGQGSVIDGQAGRIATKVDGKGKVLESRDANLADQAGGINLSISIGGSQSQSKTVQSSSTAQGSTLTAGRDINLTATGAGQESDLTIQGSSVAAGRDIKLQADNDIKLLAAQSTADQKSSNSSISGSVGISIGSSGFGVTVAASGARGKADGNDVTQTNTQIVAGNRIDLESGNDTTLKGAIVSAEQVSARVGGDLAIESLQDTSQYASKQQSLGGSVTVGAGISGSVSASRSNTNSTYASVTEQSGIKAGDGGFQVNVAGNTELKGGAITSTQAAVEQNLNRFETGGQLTTSDIQNIASYSAKAVGVNLGAGVSLDGKLAPGGSSAGLGKDGGSAASTTQSGISGIAGNKDARTGDAETGIQKIFDAEKVQREINAQVQITQAFGQQAGQAVDNYAQSQMQALRERHAATDDPAEQAALQARVDELRMETQVMNLLIGAVTGLGGTALTKETLAAAAEEMRKITIADSVKFAGITDGETTLTNTSGASAGGKWDLVPVKTGGTRADLDGLCGTDNERCMVKRDENNEFIRDANGKTQLVLNADGMVQFDAKDENKNPISLAAFLDSPAGQKMAGTTGGIQGAKGTLFGIPYAPGGLIDKVIEAFGGTHDVIGGQLPGFYDEQGNRRRGMTKAETTANETWSAVAIVPSVPFAAATLLPPEVWKAISILLGAAK